MGRETKILLTLLGLLAGVFMGVVALKLFVPRPPEGTGPDVDVASEPLPLVEPPDLDSRPIDPPSFEPPATTRDDAYAVRSSRFAAPPPVEPSASAPDLVVVPVSYEHVVEAPPAAEKISSVEELPSAPPPSFALPGSAPTESIAPVAPLRGPAPGDTYVTRDGDSWWSLAEAAYGDGRLYRALYAWNRSLNERVSLVPGTQLDIPPETKLGAAWSTLLPTD